MDKLINNEMYNSVKDSIRNKLSSSIYGTFIIYWLIFHWKFIFTIFFMSEDLILEKTRLLKNEYLSSVFFNYSDFSFWLWWILPIIFTYLSIWVFPKYILLPAFKKDQNYETDKRIFKLQKNIEIEQNRTLLEEQKTKKAEAIVNLIEQEQKIKEVDPTKEWEQEIRSFINSSHGSSFSKFLRQFYSGYTHTSNHDGGDIAYFDVLNLIKIGKNGEIEGLTDKGRYFAKRINI